MINLSVFSKIWKSKDLRKKIFITLMLLLIIRVLAHIPLPGVNAENLKNIFEGNAIFGFLDIFSGGAISRFSIILMGVGPYITASIVMQLLTMVVPSLEALSKEGEHGYRKINQYTRLLTVPLAFVESYGLITILSRGTQGQAQIFDHVLSSGELVMALLTVTAGTILLMWIGELISERGIGNGISLIITLGIIGGIPALFRNVLSVASAGGAIDYGKIIEFGLFGLFVALLVAFVIFVIEGQRNIPISYASKVRGLRSYRRSDTYLPLKVNAAGMIPIIFAVSIMLFPSTIARFLQNAKSEWLQNGADYIIALFSNNWFYASLFFLMVVFFTYFYTFVVIHPDRVSENLQKQGGFIPGIRPGKETARYLYHVINRITLFGAIFLGIIAVMPFAIPAVTQNPNLSISGAGLLIVVGVVLDTARQLRAHLVSRSYEEL